MVLEGEAEEIKEKEKKAREKQEKGKTSKTKAAKAKVMESEESLEVGIDMDESVTSVTSNSSNTSAAATTTGGTVVVYQAESPDEKALVEAARDFSYELSGRSTTSITIKVREGVKEFKPLAVNKFDSDRKRMSIVLMDQHERILMLCKCTGGREGLRLWMERCMRVIIDGWMDGYVSVCVCACIYV